MRLGGQRARRPGAAAYAAARRPPGRLAWDAAAWCVVDLELGGLDPRRDEIVSFAAIPVEHGRIRLGGAVSGLVRPTRPLPESSIRIHGLRAADLADAPPLDEAIDPLLEAMAGRPLVAHVAGIERAFLGRALRRQGLRLHGPMADTSVLGRLWLFERDGTAAPPDLPLDALAQALGLPVHARHEAMGDALTTAQVFIAAATHLSTRGGGETVAGLARAGRRLDAIRTYHATG